MSVIKKFIASVFLILGIFIIYTMVSTGFFRSVNDYFEGSILTKVAIKGAEDITISYEDRFALISATDRAAVLDEDSIRNGGLYLVDLNSEDLDPIHLTDSIGFPFEPHGISYYKEDSIYHVMAINHSQNLHSIVYFELYNQQLIHKKNIEHVSMIQPNDIVMIDSERYYFTNDHKYTSGVAKLLEEYLGRSITNVIYYDGQDFREVASGIAYANGINYDRSRSLLYVASPRKFLVKVYHRQENGDLVFIEDIDCNTGVDNIELDQEGHLWIGCHPSLLRFNAYHKGMVASAPSEVIKIRYRAKGDYDIEKIYSNKGEYISGSTVAAPIDDLLFVGNVMDDSFLILKKD